MSNIVFSSDRLLFRTSDRSMINGILDFHKRNREHFQRWESEKSEDYFTKLYVKYMVKYEKKQLRSLKEIAFWLSDRDASPERIIGRVSVFGIIPGNYSSCIIGYKIDKDYEGKGYMKEALLCAERFLEQNLGIKRIEALILPENERSVMLILSCGYVYEGVCRSAVEINGERRDHLRFYKLFGGQS